MVDGEGDGIVDGDGEPVYEDDGREWVSNPNEEIFRRSNCFPLQSNMHKIKLSYPGF